MKRAREWRRSAAAWARCLRVLMVDWVEGSANHRNSSAWRGPNSSMSAREGWPSGGEGRQRGDQGWRGFRDRGVSWEEVRGEGRRAREQIIRQADGVSGRGESRVRSHVPCGSNAFLLADDGVVHGGGTDLLRERGFRNFPMKVNFYLQMPTASIPPSLGFRFGHVRFCNASSRSDFGPL